MLAWMLHYLAGLVRVQAMMPGSEASRFDSYCREKGFKKSPVIARLVGQYLDRETFKPQPDLFRRE